MLALTESLDTKAMKTRLGNTPDHEKKGVKDEIQNSYFINKADSYLKLDYQVVYFEYLMVWL